jgi:hypothetical protein
MLLALLVMGGYTVTVAVVALWFHFRPPAPDPSIAAIRINEYLRKGRR